MIKLLQQLKDMGINAVVAGGAVRDQIRGVDPTDIDVWLLGDTSNVNPDVLASLLTNPEVQDNTDSAYYNVRILVKGSYVDSGGITRRVDIIVPGEHYNSPVELVGSFDFSINQGFVGIDCGFYRPDLSSLTIINADRVTSERYARFQAMVDYYNHQEQLRREIDNKSH